MVQCGVGTQVQHGGAALALIALMLLGGCSGVPDAVNPVVWYRDLTGASKNDALDRNQPNQKNLEAGSKSPYPNLADVPDAPDRALSTIDRDKLQKSLAADRDNAKYSADRLRAGVAGPDVVPRPASPTRAAATPAAAAEAQAPPPPAPDESPLTSPTVRSVPAGESPAPPPPPPNIPPVSSPDAAPTVPVARTAALGSGQRRSAPSSSVSVAAVGFADGSAALSEDSRNQLSEIAAMQHQQGGTVRIVGHAKPGKGSDAMQQQLDGFALAMARARAVEKELAAEGVPAGALAVEATPSRANDPAGSSAELFLEH